MNRGPANWRPGAAALVLVLSSACTPGSDTPERRPAPRPDAPAASPLLATPPPLGRAGLLAAVGQTASATAAGAPYPGAVRALEGRRFALRLPFGCWGPGPAEAGLGYTADAARGALRLTARPETWTDAPFAAPLTEGQEVESVEGFWLSRPWTTSEACPALSPAQLPGTAPSPETLGLAQVFAEGGSRLLRRGGRPYEATVKLAEGEVPGVGGYRLVLEGRLAGGPDHRPIVCRSDHPDRRPTCMARVELDRVAFEDAGGRTLAEWRS
ncbi:hypothetical protein [Phenylobacterium sp.]|uniref:hypothetical protein n=1 Tax=Phenylobacterium sp. TaxID=1871053 RepID=UPI00391C9EE6